VLQHRNQILLCGVVKETFCVGLDGNRPSLTVHLDVRLMTTDPIPVWVRLKSDDWLRTNHERLIGRSLVVSAGQMLSYTARESGERVFRVQTYSNRLATTDSFGCCARASLVGQVAKYAKVLDGHVFMLQMKTKSGTNHVRILSREAVKEGRMVAVEGSIEFQRSKRFLVVRSDRVDILQ